MLTAEIVCYGSKSLQTPDCSSSPVISTEQVLPPTAHDKGRLLAYILGVMIEVRYRKGPLSQKSAGHLQNHKTKTNTNLSPDPDRYRRRCPDPNARIQKFIHCMAIATFAIVDLCDSRLSPH